LDVHHIIALYNVVNDLPNGPSVGGLGEIELRFSEASDGSFQLSRAISMAGEN